MDIEIKGDLVGLSDQQLDFIKRKINENSIKGKDVTVAVLGQTGDNMASAMKVITIKNEKEDFKIITKVTHNISRVLNDINLMSNLMFTNEITMYNEVLPMMVKLQKNAGIEPSDMFPVPICYGSSNETPHEIILLQDLRKEKYVMLDKFKPLPSDTIKLILRTLAQYHSLCFVLKENSPEVYAEYCKKIVNMSTAEVFIQHRETFMLIGPQLSRIFEDKLVGDIIIDAINKHVDRILKLEKSDKGSKYTIIVHGDCWTNNFLFQLQDDKPTKCIMIDYQLVKEASPVVDILHLIFNCTDYETRSKHYQEWLDYYHSQLEKQLFAHGLKINITYSKDKFESDVNRYAKVSLGMSIFASSLMIRNNEEMAKVKETMLESDSVENFTNNFNVSDLQTESVLQIKKRVEGVINSCIDFGYLNTRNFM